MSRVALCLTCLALATAGCSTPRSPERMAGSSAPPASAATAGCIQETGSRIAPSPAAGCSSPGRSYGADELRQTGQADPAGALSLLDPTVQVHH